MYDAIASEQAAITNRAINVWSCAKSVIKLVTEIRHRGVFFYPRHNSTAYMVYRWWSDFKSQGLFSYLSEFREHCVAAGQKINQI